MEEIDQPEDLKVCIVQFDIAWEDAEANWNKVNALLRNEVGKHDLIVLPEMFNTGFSMSPKGIAEPVGGHTENFMRFLAGKMGAVVMGSVVTEENGQYFNRFLVVNHEGLVLKYDKRHLFRMAGEHEAYAAGKELTVFSLKGWRICPLVCYDLRFPVWSRNGKHADGGFWYDLLIYVANWPAKRSAHWKCLLQARAIENQACLIGANRVGTDGNGIAYDGDSMVCDARGTILAHNEGEEKLLFTTLVWSEMAEYRAAFPAWQDADQFGLYA